MLVDHSTCLVAWLGAILLMGEREGEGEGESEQEQQIETWTGHDRAVFCFRGCVQRQNPVRSTWPDQFELWDRSRTVDWSVWFHASGRQSGSSRCPRIPR